MQYDPNVLTCAVCGAEVKDYLGNHLLEAHKLTTEEYQGLHPGALTVSTRLWTQFQATVKTKKREVPCPVEQLRVKFGLASFPVNTDVPVDVCLPLPEHYAIPEYGELGEDVSHAIVALVKRRSAYIHGLPGSGKDALYHAFSYMTRTPTIIQQIQPGSDIQAWFFSRSFNEHGTYWEEGEVLKALRDGYLTASGRRVPYMLLVSDFDRASREQAEYLRLVTDSIRGRVQGPAGRTYPTLPGSYIIATANTAGGGDERGRMISANPQDASLLERFNVTLMFHWMDWRDESKIIQRKFPLLLSKAPSILKKMEGVTKALREAILNDDLHGEFSHRALCKILQHATDIVEVSGKMDKKLLKWASRVWVESLPDDETRQTARNIMDPRLGMLDEGDTSHIHAGNISAAMGKGGGK